MLPRCRSRCGNDPTAIVTRADQINFFILVAGFGLALAASVVHVLRALQQYLQALHDLAPEDANDLATQLVFGGETLAGASVLRVQSGRVDLDGPPIVHKVGGPARLSVDLNNAVVTSRLGVLRDPGCAGLTSCSPTSGYGRWLTCARSAVRWSWTL